MAVDGNDPQSEKPESEILREKGNMHFKAGEYDLAIEAYTNSIQLNPSQHLCHSNRSAAYLKRGNSGAEALADARRCVELAPTWAKSYSRLAAAFEELKQYDEAAAACDEGLEKSPEADAKTLRDMRKKIQSNGFGHRLQGPWHGRVSQQLGDYEQELEFIDHQYVRINVMGKSIIGVFECDASQDPVHVDIKVQASPEPGADAETVKYIMKLDDEGLHTCSPYMTMDRPKDFNSPGFCLLKRGALPRSDNSDVLGLSSEEKLLLCAREITAALPEEALEEPLPTDSEKICGEKMMKQVRFNAQMYNLEQRFGEDTMGAVLGSAKDVSKAQPPLADSPELAALVQALTRCKLFEPPPPVKKSEPVAAPEPKSRDVNVGKEPKTHTAADAESRRQLLFVGAVALAAAAAAATAVWWQRRRR